MTNKEKKIKKLLSYCRTTGEEYLRIGSENDGGYVMVNDFTEKDYAISCGIEDGVHFVGDLDFEEQISEISKGLDMYDYAIDSLNHNFKNGRFFKAELGDNFGLKEMIANAGEQEDYILKMDVEGAEFDVFFNAESSEINKFRQMIVEFHWLQKLATDDTYYFKFLNVFHKISKTHHIVWFHGNNHSGTFEYGDMVIPEVVEILFLRKDSYKFTSVNSKEADNLDKLTRPCSTSVPDIIYDMFFL
jgi:hypothetical protein